MRSLLETRIGFLLDRLRIPWEYEPKRFQLSRNQSYLPDFKLTETDQWIEGKGKLSEEDERKIKKFVTIYQEPVILIKSASATYYEPSTKGHVRQGQVNTIKCSKCSSIGLVPNLGKWHCRNCGHHNGDQDITAYGFYRDNFTLKNFQSAETAAKRIEEDVRRLIRVDR